MLEEKVVQDTKAYAKHISALFNSGNADATVPKSMYISAFIRTLFQ